MLERFLKLGACVAHAAQQADRGNAKRSGVNVVCGLATVDVVKRVDGVIVAARMAQALQCEICHDLVDVHIRGRARAALKRVHDERFVGLTGNDRIARLGNGAVDM
ncbi:hypothetical protein SDC9_174868 [bioreactor metagenome]|uniref:Uncharacterized protein n=1 Tax=bioreactor metagenome TaxID=1076179 RepID=A0A645GL41_9ZZZZ